MEGYPSLVKGTVLKTVRSFAARGFESHTFLIIKIKESLCQIPIKNRLKNNTIKLNGSLKQNQRLRQTKLSSENGPKNNVKTLNNF